MSSNMLSTTTDKHISASTTTITGNNNNNREMATTNAVKSYYDPGVVRLIIYNQLSIVNKKDFAEEVRALLDVRKFVADSFILTDVIEVRIEAIVETIVDRLVECRQLGPAVADEAKTQLFVDRNSLSMVLANTMQGLYKSRSDGRLAYDHNWIVATCSLSSLQKRQVAITRFALPINFGRQSQEVRFLVIVMAPSKEKLTKGAWETGRTFATMFTDIDFRRRLLRAKNQDEIKAELLARAERLANEQTQQDGDQADEFKCAKHDNRNSNNNNSNYFDSNNHGKPLGQHQVIVCDQQQANAIQQTYQRPTVFLENKLSRAPFHKSHSTNWPTFNSSARSDSLQIDSYDNKQQNGRSLSPPQGLLRRLSLKSLSSRKSAARGGNDDDDDDDDEGATCCCGIQLGGGLLDDLRRRSKFYLSDFTDGFLGERSLYKTISTTIFLYFSVLLPCIAFGVVDTNNTDGHIDPKKTMIGQALGGLFFALFSGQPLIVVMTTAPLCIYVKVIYLIAQDLEVDFGSFYACVGLWMSLFLIIFSLTNASALMKHCTRSTEDIFALFTAFAFGTDGIREALRSFQKHYWEPDCATHHTQHVLVARTLPEHSTINTTPLVGLNATTNRHQHAYEPTEEHVNVQLAASTGGNLSETAFALASQTFRCQRETCILFLFLMFGTLWLANSFNSFDRTPYLSSRKREIIKDYALAIAVLIFSFVGSYLFADIKLDVFEFGDFAGLHLAQMSQLSTWAMSTACLLGFMASVLFYIDQNICGAMVNNAPYRLKKGNYFHLDLLVLAILNTFLSLTGLPWMHGKLPHSHLHSKALADYEERVDDGHIHQTIVNIRETRMTGLLVSVLVGLSLMAVPYPLSYIPLPVLSGVFLYTALAEFKSNSMIERVCLLFTEQVAYPPNHYIRRCPQRQIHLFTLAQLIQLAIVSFIGFYPNPYVNMAFPLIVAMFVIIRGSLLPKLIDAKYLQSLDRASLE